MNCDSEYCEGVRMDEHPVYEEGLLVRVEHHCPTCPEINTSPNNLMCMYLSYLKEVIE